MIQRLSRRAFLSLISSGVAATAHAAFGADPQRPNTRQLARVGEFVRYLDEITETPVVRLTTLETASSLPARENRAVSVKGRFLVFSSDRAGPLSPFRLDLRNGQVLSLAPATKLDTRSLTIDTAGRLLYFLDGQTVKQLNLSNRKVQTIAEPVSGFSLAASASDMIVIRNGRLFRPDGQRVSLAEDAVWCQVRPEGGGCLFTRKTPAAVEDLWFSTFGASSQPIRLAEGPLSNPCWSPDGRSALFLRDGAICEVSLDSKTERRIGGVSRFVTFSPNADSSVFVGAVRSKAQPTINLLLRTPPREFTLCEHKASHPEDCAPVFSADSRRVYFNSDFQGKPAIYSVNVEGLIEETFG